MHVTGYHLLELARALARVKHAGQSRKGSGEPYFNHLSRVASRVIGWRAKALAYLHDLIEDTDLTADDLILLGFPEDLVNDVVALSRREGHLTYPDALDGSATFVPPEEYFDFIERTTRDGSDDALYVKLADLADNLYDPSGWASESLRARYVKSDLMVRAELVRRGRLVPGPEAAAQRRSA